ncbi:MAG: regulator, partial [Candidatus Latescibacterota bacterium]
MNKLLFILCLLSLGFIGKPLEAQTGWVQTNGPYGARIMCFAVSGTNIFAGNYNGGVFLSTNNGASWTAVNTGLIITPVYSLAVSGMNIFAGTNDG